MCATTGDIQDPLITLQGDQDALRPINTDSDIYAQLVRAQGHSARFRCYPVRGGNHIEPLLDAEFGVDR
jgi:acetyl esterase/lipase